MSSFGLCRHSCLVERWGCVQANQGIWIHPHAWHQCKYHTTKHANTRTLGKHLEGSQRESTLWGNSLRVGLLMLMKGLMRVVFASLLWRMKFGKIVESVWQAVPWLIFLWNVPLCVSLRWRMSLKKVPTRNRITTLYLYASNHWSSCSLHPSLDQYNIQYVVNLVTWCEDDHLQLGVNKIKELVVDDLRYGCCCKRGLNLKTRILDTHSSQQHRKKSQQSLTFDPWPPKFDRVILESKRALVTHLKSIYWGF